MFSRLSYSCKLFQTFRPVIAKYFAETFLLLLFLMIASHQTFPNILLNHQSLGYLPCEFW